MKKLLSIILVVALLVNAMPMGAFEFKASAATEGYYTYEVSNGETTITDVDESISGDITIPSALGGYPVTSIGDDAFAYCESLTNVIIPNSVTSIGVEAFRYCSNLENITISDSVTSIGIEAFAYCGRLASVIIPNSVTSIGDYAFFWCRRLKSLRIGDSVTIIGRYAFYCCDFLTNVIMANSVKNIDTSAFDECDSLTSVYYRGSKEDRLKISIGTSNSKLTNATWYYNACIGSADHTYDNLCDNECNICGVTHTITHNYEWIIDKQNNCGVNGMKHEECTVCQAKRNENTVIPATGNHTYGNACDAECNLCNEKRSVPEHNYGNDLICDECGYKNYTLGDIDDDSVVALTDVVTLAQYVAGWDITCNENALDVNGNDIVNLQDIVHLAQYVAGWEGITLH